MAKSSGKDMLDARIDHGASWFPSDIATDRAIAPGCRPNEDLQFEKVKFAHDVTIWITGKYCRELIEVLKSDFGNIMKWAKKWRLKLSMLKTEFCLFFLDNGVLEEARAFRFCVEGQLLKYNPNPKILGVTLDEKMKFEIPIESVERKAIRSLQLLRKVKETEVINTKRMFQLYKALMVPQLEYAASVWQIRNCTGLDRVQRKSFGHVTRSSGNGGH